MRPLIGDVSTLVIGGKSKELNGFCTLTEMKENGVPVFFERIIPIDVLSVDYIDLNQSNQALWN